MLYVIVEILLLRILIMATDDLRINKDNKLKKLFIKGPKYREQRIMNFD